MDVAEKSQGPASKRRKQAIAEIAESISTDFWDAGSAWSRTTFDKQAHDDCFLCSSCQSLLIRPSCDPDSQMGTAFTEQRWIIRKSRTGTFKTAMNGCIICKLVIAAQATIYQHTTSAGQLDSFKLALYWSNRTGTTGRFHRIDVMPVDHMNNTLSFHGHINGIKLVLEDGNEDKAICYTSPLHTGSEVCRSIATQWLVNCTTHHAKCREKLITPNWLPARLIDVGVSGEQPRLILTSELGRESNTSYVTLSHRWASTHIVKLESSNIDSFKQCIPLESLSSTFLDAVKVTRALSCQYLWIDSLCIIQDSLADWQRESTEMGSIYRNCVCNIAATGGSDNGGGLFQERNRHWVTPNKVRIRYEGHDKVYLATLNDPWGKWISRSSLNRRGWVLQERLLSPRTLHFASQLFWECRMLQACETYPEGMPDSDISYQEVDGTELPITLKYWSREFEASHTWTDIVQTYGKCSITVPDDRLIAVAGIAKSIQPLMNDRYLAGLWRKNLPYNLAWSLANTDGDLELSEKYRCPSWSWAALNYTSAAIEDLLIPVNCRVEALASVIEAYIEPLGPDVFGHLLGGYLRLRGRIGRIFSLTGRDRAGEWVGGHWSWLVQVDLYSGSDDNELLHCLPLFVRRQNPGPDWPTFTDCLLLKQLKPGIHEYSRIGLLKVSLDLEDILPQEIKWIVEHAKSEPCLRDLVTVTIF